MTVLRGIGSLVAYAALGLVVIGGVLTGGLLWGILLGLAIMGKLVVYMTRRKE